MLFNLPLRAIEPHYNFSIGRIAFVLSYLHPNIKIFILESKTPCIRHTVAYVKCAAQIASRIPSMSHPWRIHICLFIYCCCFFWFGFVLDWSCMCICLHHHLLKERKRKPCWSLNHSIFEGDMGSLPLCTCNKNLDSIWNLQLGWACRIAPKKPRKLILLGEVVLHWLSKTFLDVWNIVRVT